MFNLLFVPQKYNIKLRVETHSLFKNVFLVKIIGSKKSNQHYCCNVGCFFTAVLFVF